MLEAVITAGSVLVGLALYEAGKRAIRQWQKQRRRRAWTPVILD